MYVFPSSLPPISLSSPDGFRKMTPIERSGLARAESDQDHLEFSHPYFVREHPELLGNIKRKTTSTTQRAPDCAKVSVQTHDLGLVLDELKQLREKQKHMETKMTHLVKYCPLAFILHRELSIAERMRRCGPRCRMFARCI